VIPLTDDRWRRLESLFLAAVDLHPAERQSFVARETGGDPVLGRELAGMLAHDADGGQRIAAAIQTVASGLATLTAWAGSHCGPYRIIRESGRGGMGVVFEAVRDDAEYRKTVAVKIVPPWTDAAVVRERFRLERQILAELEHPNIARFLDGGTEHGMPYFVMEYVDGLPITTFCERHALDLTARIALFRQVCGAVHFAHESLIVHRDLKPSNILVTDDGTPKLLDFGIAKLLDPFGGSTATIDAGWTPDYTSPEQVPGRPVTTRTDVYSLGLILYELLAGERAQVADSSSAMALDRSICEAEAPPPSVRAAARERVGAQRLRGDLDTIVLMAIRKEPERRYATPSALIEDLDRFLDGRPVLARPGTAIYRARKFVWRHRLGTLAAALILSSLTAGLGMALFEARRAERRFREVRSLANSFVFDVHDRIESLPGATDARKSIVQTALIYLESLRQDAGNDPALARELAAAYLKIGTAQGAPLRSNLGDPAGAITSFGPAEALLDPLAAKGDIKARRTLMSVLSYLATVREAQGQTTDRDAALARAAQIGEGVLAANGNDTEVLSTLSDVYASIARAAVNGAQLEAAERAARRSLDLTRRLAELAPANREYRDNVASAVRPPRREPRCRRSRGAQSQGGTQPRGGVGALAYRAAVGGRRARSSEGDHGARSQPCRPQGAPAPSPVLKKCGGVSACPDAAGLSARLEGQRDVCQNRSRSIRRCCVSGRSGWRRSAVAISDRVQSAARSPAIRHGRDRRQSDCPAEPGQPRDSDSGWLAAGSVPGAPEVLRRRGQPARLATRRSETRAGGFSRLRPQFQPAGERHE
jgi:eukaryotic-like serine/threonine-protein kinase